MAKLKVHEPDGFSELPSRDYLHDCFRYDGETGLLYWKARPIDHFKDSPQRSAKWKVSFRNSRFAGRLAFTSSNGSGHRATNLDGQKLYAHRVVWKMAYGCDPLVIDHINGNPSDNRLCNLRSVTHQENLRNTKLSRANTSGVKGVTAHQTVGFEARIHGAEGESIAKWFKSFDDAVMWRKAMERKFGYVQRGAS